MQPTLAATLTVTVILTFDLVTSRSTQPMAWTTSLPTLVLIALAVFFV